MPTLEPSGGTSEDGTWMQPLTDDASAPTSSARVRIERENLKVQVEVPDRHAGHLLDLLRWAVAAALAVAGPPLTLNAMPELFPAWMTFTLVVVQLAVSVYVAWMFGRRYGGSGVT
jgi:hypothetical protein